MFPDLTRDDVFRLETQRLWLRWPRASDAAAIARIAGRPDVALMTAAIPHPYPAGAAQRFVLAAREGNAEGRAMELVATLKTTREPVGLVSARQAAEGIEIGYLIDPERWGEGLASEAVEALIDVVFALTFASRLVARVFPENLASQRVLEKLGFAFEGEETADLPARGGAKRFRRYRANREARAGLRARRVPAMTQQEPTQQGPTQQAIGRASADAPPAWA